MKKRILARRELALRKTIDSLFREMQPDHVDRLAANFEVSIMEMFSVSRIDASHIELTHLFNDDVYGPVELDTNVHGLLEINDTFLMTLGLKDDTWHVLYMSPPYETWTC